MKTKAISALAFCLLVLPALSFGAGEARVLRFPAVSYDQVVFSYGGDLYTVPLAGGLARKLTSFYEGYEAFARFSPDGKSIAFTGEYDGNREVYLIPAEGGAPKRLTYTPTLGRDDISDRMGPNNLVMGWTPDGKSVVFRSRMREWNDFNGQLYLVPSAGGTPDELPLPRGGFCSFSPDGKKFAYNRIFREFRTWKRYRGGMADDIWVYDFATKKIENITNNPALDLIPMWKGDRIYFVSDRDDNKRVNLYVYDLKTRETRKLTEFAEYDIKFPSLGPNHIVFENGGYIYKFDLASEKTDKLPVTIADDAVGARSRLTKVADQITGGDISPDGKRALFGAHGEIFTVPAQYGNTRNLTRTPGVHERNGVWSPDGKWIAYISDKTGEDEIYIRAQDGSGEPQQLTKNADTYKYQLFWSPDGKKIMWDDRLQRLNCLDVATKEVVTIVKAEAGEIQRFAWSPDSRWITYAKPEVETMMKVYLYSLDAKKTYEVTDGWYNSADPAFSADGKYLFFVSNRDFNPIFSATEFDHAYLSLSRVYFVTLAKDTKSPFEPKSDEVAVKKEAEAPAPAAPAKAAAKPETKTEAPATGAVPIKVDPDGLKGRIIALPIETANYGDITAVGNAVYYLRVKDMENQPSLMLYDLGELKEKDLGKIGRYGVSADGKKMLVVKDRAFGIIDLPKGPVSLESRLDLSGMECTVDPRQEWNQIYEECWRQMKYFFYAPNMHGIDWAATRRKYEPLVASANSRADLTYVIGEMIAELSAGHAYVGGGDIARPQRIQTGLLGAEIERDPASKYYRIKKILKGQNWNPGLVSPLTQIGVNAREGDFILAVNGRPTSQMANLYQALVDTVGKQVSLRLNSKPTEAGSRVAVVVPIANEAPLYYYNWVEANIAKVSTASGDRVGYIHIPDMSDEGLNEFVKYFYPQLRKKALIIDVRGNGGGSVSPLVIDRLRRQIAMVGVARNTSAAPDPFESVMGPMVCLLDEFSASDGDIFPYRFKKYNLGKLIGKRSWGGVVGIRNSLPLLDGGSLFKPEFATYGSSGEGWIIEGHGVDPDIVVDNDPAREFAGIDEQLDKAIAVILEELKTKGQELPPIPVFPDKSK